MNMVLFAGFLGAGKTTIVLKIAQHAVERDNKVAIIVNEMGEIGIDNQLMKQQGLNVNELVNGCICCTLSADLVTTLHQLDSEYSPQLVIIEPSGAADPRTILSAFPYYHGAPIENLQVVCVVDPLRLEMLLEVMKPLVTSQIQQANLILVSKTDIASPEQIEYTHQAVGEINPGAKLFYIQKDTPTADLVKVVAPWMN